MLASVFSNNRQGWRYFYMFGLFKKKPRKTALDAFAELHNQMAPKKGIADTNIAADLASELLRGHVRKEVLFDHGVRLNDGPIAYSTHELASCVAMYFFKRLENKQDYFVEQIGARQTVRSWYQQGLIQATYLQIFEDTLYKAFKP